MLLGASLLTGLGTTPASAVGDGPACTANGSTQTCVYGYTGGPQTWTVPYGVTAATVTAYGAKGGPGSSYFATKPNTFGGAGGRIVADLTGLGAGWLLQVKVGGTAAPPGAPQDYGRQYARGGFNGGGDGWSGGGGASDVRAYNYTTKQYALADRVVVAGGGGSYSPGFYGTLPPIEPAPLVGGGGGGEVGAGVDGETAQVRGIAYGGTQTAGGSNSAGGAATCSAGSALPKTKGSATDGAFGTGGSCLFFTNGEPDYYMEGGGGGGGWYGGGFGPKLYAGPDYYVGGAGGSSHAGARNLVGVSGSTTATGGTFTPPAGMGDNGRVEISWTVPGYLGSNGSWSAASGQVTSFTSSGRAYKLVMQGDGNLVQTDTASGQAVWASATAGNPGATARFTAEGRLVVLGPTGALLWRSATGAGPHSAFAAGANGSLAVTDAQGRLRWSTTTTTRMQYLTLIPDSAIAITGHQLVMQWDGNLVWIDAKARALWASNTWGHDGQGYYADFGLNTLAVRNRDGNPMWTAPLFTAYNRVLSLQLDGNIVISENNGQAVWATNTFG
ncbi:hypothetical protein OG389_03365 [Streptomyces sp. NBC_00435]|uniref:hypothetical protein n=1 Tax=Streptomyces sp. NBC_00435 TaxID=2903649 RepID=UPI002E2479AF